MSAVQFKLMPEGLDIDLKAISEKAEATIRSLGGVFSGSEEHPIAFGLKALVVSLAFPESKEIDAVGNALEQIPGVSSVEMTDYRRAIG